MGLYLRPQTLPDALSALAAGRYTILSGATDHFPARVLATPAEDILDIGAIAELDTIRLDAEVELARLGGRRRMKVADFVLGNRRTARAPDELVLGVHIPLPARPGSSVFEKLGARAYLVISIVAVAVSAEFLPDRRIAALRVAVGACSPRAMRLPALEAALAGLLPDPALVSEDHLAPLSPIDDVRASAAYRRAATLVLLRRAIARLLVPEARAA